jgi:Flp pilus assembly protein TadB
MITTAITAALAAILTYFGVEPGLYVAPLWLAVKVMLVFGIGFFVWKKERNALREKQSAAAASAPQNERAQDQEPGAR